MRIILSFFFLALLAVLPARGEDFSKGITCIADYS